MLQLIACDCTCSDSDAAAPGATAAARAECAAERAARGCYDYAAIEAACEADPTKLNALCKVPIDTTQVAQCPNAQYPAQCPIPYLMLDARCPMPNAHAQYLMPPNTQCAMLNAPNDTGGEQVGRHHQER